MNTPPQIRWILFALAVPISLYVCCLGTLFMGFCPGLECWPHTFAWILLTPCLFLAIWSLRATAITAVLLLLAHVYTEVHVFHGGLTADTLWGTDKGLDTYLWIVVLLLVVSAVLPAPRARTENRKQQIPYGDDNKNDNGKNPTSNI